MAASWGPLQFSVLPATLCCDRKNLPGCLWSLENPSYLRVPEISWSSHNQCSFRQDTTHHSPDMLTDCLLRCALQCFRDSPLLLVKITFVKLYFFFSWVANMSQRPLLLRNQGLTTILQSVDLLFTFYLCKLASCLW